MAIVIGTRRSETLYGTEGDDEIYGFGGNDFLEGYSGNDLLDGGDGADTLRGRAGDDTLLGGNGDDNMWGQKGADYLDGGAGKDLLWAGADADIQIGGAGADTFEFRSKWESTDLVYTGTDPEFEFTGIDQILDFESGTDKIDLSKVDANETTVVEYTRKGQLNNEAFQFVTETDGITPGHLTVSYNAATNTTTIQAYTDTIAGADMMILVTGMLNPGTDFVL